MEYVGYVGTYRYVSVRVGHLCRISHIGVRHVPKRHTDRDLIHLHSHALRVARKLRRVHTLNSCNPIAEIALVVHTKLVFKYVCAFAQVVEEEVGRRIAGAFVITQTTLIFVLTQHIHRLKARCTHIFHVNIFHVTVHSKFNTHLY